MTIEQQIEQLVVQYAEKLQRQGSDFSLSQNRDIIRELVRLGDLPTACTCLNLAGVRQQHLNYLIGPTVPFGADLVSNDDDFDGYIRELCYQSRLEQIFQEHQMGIVGNMATVADVFFFLDHEEELTTPYRWTISWAAYHLLGHTEKTAPVAIRDELSRVPLVTVEYDEIANDFEKIARVLRRRIAEAALDLGLPSTFQGLPVQQPQTVKPRVRAPIPSTIVTPRIQLEQPGLIPLKQLLSREKSTNKSLSSKALFAVGDWVEWQALVGTEEELEFRGRCLGIVLEKPAWVQFPSVNQAAGWHYCVLQVDRYEWEPQTSVWLYESQLSRFDPTSECCNDSRTACEAECWVDCRRRSLREELPMAHMQAILQAADLKPGPQPTGETFRPKIAISPQKPALKSVEVKPRVESAPSTPALTPIAGQRITTGVVVKPKITIQPTLPTSTQRAIGPANEKRDPS